MNEYNSSIASKCDYFKCFVNPNVPITKHDRYTHDFRSLGGIDADIKLWDGDHIYLPYEPTNEEATIEKMDQHIGSQISLNPKKGRTLAKVVFQQRDTSGTLISTSNTIPQLDSRIYNVKFDDGHYEQYTTNVLAEARATTHDKTGFDTGLIVKISGYRKRRTSIPRSQDHFLKKSGNRISAIITKG